MRTTLPVFSLIPNNLNTALSGLLWLGAVFKLLGIIQRGSVVNGVPNLKCSWPLPQATGCQHSCKFNTYSIGNLKDLSFSSHTSYR